MVVMHARYPRQGSAGNICEVVSKTERDLAVDELRIQKELSTAQQADLEAFQDSFTGAPSIVPELRTLSFDCLRTASNESENEDYDDS
ncbi:hypothetical protein FS749_015089 [Ceratobasidium sp. UAMH 11750]|nr:hypothetical protein FS749_015089 [Ceratobasidium sp. UAMH 11750]